MVFHLLRNAPTLLKGFGFQTRTANLNDGPNLLRCCGSIEMTAGWAQPSPDIISQLLMIGSDGVCTNMQSMAEENRALCNLKINPVVLSSLGACGFHHLDDLRRLTNVQILQNPNMGRASYKRILAALDRPPVVGGPIYMRRKRAV